MTASLLQGIAVHLTTVHRPEDTRIFVKECRSLAAAGADVVLVVPGASTAGSDGVRYHPIPMPGSRVARVFVAPWHALRAALVERGDVYHFHDPELIPVGLLLKLLGKRVIYDVHEDVAAQVDAKHWVAPVLRRPLKWAIIAAHRAVARVFDAIVVAGEDIAPAFRGAEVVVLRNYPLLAEFDGPVEWPLGVGVPALVYLGGLSRARAAIELIAALDMVPKNLDVQLTVAGSFTDDGTEEECRIHAGWDRVEYLGWLPRRRTVEVLRRSTIGIALYKPGPNHGGLRSNRVFEYMAAGLPVIGPDLPAWRRLFDAVGCGVLVDPTSPDAIAAAITGLLTDADVAAAMGRRGRLAVERTYSWEAECGALRALYARFMGARPSAVAMKRQ